MLLHQLQRNCAVMLQTLVCSNYRRFHICLKSFAFQHVGKLCFPYIVNPENKILIFSGITIYTRKMNYYPMAKGITPVIALILLLVITIVIVGFTFTIFQNITSTAGTAAENQTEETSLRLASCIRLESVNANGDVYIRNCGSSDITAGSVSVYARPEGGSYTLLDVTNDNDVVAGGGIGTLLLDYGSIPSGLTDIRIVSASGVSDFMNDQNIQTSAPRIYLYEPIDNVVLDPPPQTVTFRCEAYDDDNGLTSGNLELRTSITGTMALTCTDGQACDTNSTPDANRLGINHTVTISTAGTYYWNCNATDIVGNPGAGIQRSFRIRSIGGDPPIAQLASPAEGYSDNDGIVDFSCSATDIDGDLASIDLVLDGVQRDADCPPMSGDGSSATLACQISGIGAGAHTWTCKAVDSNNNQHTPAARNFQVNLAGNPPVVTLGLPAEGYVDNDGSVQFTCSATDADGNLANLDILIDGAVQAGCTETGNGDAMNMDCIVNNIADGAHTWTCRATDGVNQVQPSARNFQVTVNPPGANLDFPGDNAAYTGIVWVNFTCNTTDNRNITQVELMYSKNSEPLNSMSINYPYKKNILGPNSNFETGPPPWLNSPGTLNESSWPYSSSVYLGGDGLEGSASTRIIPNGYLTRYFTTTWNSSTSNVSLLKPNTMYYVGAYINITPGAGGTGTASVLVYKGDGTTDTVISLTGAKEEYLRGTFTTGAAVINASINLTYTGPAGSWSYYDAIMVEEVAATNYTDKRTYLSYEETNDTCDVPTQCIGVKNVTTVSGIVSYYLQDSLWSNETSSAIGYLDNDGLFCGPGETCGDAILRIDNLENGMYEIAIRMRAPPTMSFNITANNGPIVTFASPSSTVWNFVPVLNVTITNNVIVLNLTTNTNSGGRIDRIRLVPKWVSDFRSSFSIPLEPSVYDWTCRATDDEAHSTTPPTRRVTVS